MHPLVRRTWAPRGQTPVLEHRARHHRKISAIGGISLSPHRRRLGWYLNFHSDDSIRQQEIIAFLRHLSAIFAATSSWSGTGSALIGAVKSETTFEGIGGCNSKNCPPMRPSSTPTNMAGVISSTASWPTSARTTWRSLNKRSLSQPLVLKASRHSSDRLYEPASCQLNCES